MLVWANKYVIPGTWKLARNVACPSEESSQLCCAPATPAAILLSGAHVLVIVLWNHNNPWLQEHEYYNIIFLTFHKWKLKLFFWSTSARNLHALFVLVKDCSILTAKYLTSFRKATGPQKIFTTYSRDYSQLFYPVAHTHCLMSSYW